MIVKIDHLAFASTDIAKDVKRWLALGYKIKFIENGIRNLEIKRGLMKKFSPRQSLAFLEKEGSFNVELVSHDHISPGASLIVPAPKNNNQPNFKLNEVIVQTSDISKGLKFWQLFGFRLIKKRKNLILIEFKTPLVENPLRLRILSVKKKKNRENFLDTSGFNCLAFITTSPEDQMRVLEEGGYQTTKFEIIKVNNKQLKVFFAKGPGGELAEIIEVVR